MFDNISGLGWPPPRAPSPPSPPHGGWRAPALLTQATTPRPCRPRSHSPCSAAVLGDSAGRGRGARFEAATWRARACVPRQRPQRLHPPRPTRRQSELIYALECVRRGWALPPWCLLADVAGDLPGVICVRVRRAVKQLNSQIEQKSVVKHTHTRRLVGTGRGQGALRCGVIQSSPGDASWARVRIPHRFDGWTAALPGCTRMCGAKHSNARFWGARAPRCSPRSWRGARRFQQTATAHP